ncbi:MAG TPA: hypothetical protein VHJ37_11025 [Thermoleophilaceae bacterium]|jgi:hypothetical protein|nr:hypothetical protein [Thermoleophilaceae bacterium]
MSTSCGIASLDDLLHRHPRRAGAAALRKALEGRRAGATVTKSELEEMFIEFLDELGLPRPEANPALSAAGSVYVPDCLGVSSASWSSWTAVGFTPPSRPSRRTASATVT